MSRRISAPQPSAPVGVQWQLTSVPRAARITMAQRARFQLWLVARNTGTTAVGTQRDSLRWYVNNVESMELQMAWSNGVRSNDWASLAPRATVREAREMGTTLFARPGTYTITVQQSAREVARLVVTVR